MLAMWGEPHNVIRKFKIARDGQKDDCTAWVLFCIEMPGPPGPSGPSQVSYSQENVDNTAHENHASDAHMQNAHAVSRLEKDINVIGEGPEGPGGPGLTRAVSPNWDDSDPDYVCPF